MKERLKKIREGLYELPRSGGMRVPAWIFLSERLLREVEEDAIKQISNVAHLPGIYKHSIALPDMHVGYGFPIGGVAALDAREGGLSPGGIGFDINCGVRLLRTNLKEDDVKKRLKELLEKIFRNVPSGVGRSGKVRLTPGSLRDVLEMGASWAVENGYGTENDLKRLEENGCMKSADASTVSNKALVRGAPQLGSLGAGNHFLEIQKVEKIFLPEVASVLGLEENQICVMIHTGSRGFGHQVCTDYIQILERAFREELRRLPDRQLVYAPAETQECKDYFAAMSCAANFAWCNRQMITHWVRESIYRTLGVSEEELGLEVVYDVAHNIGKLESHEIDGSRKKVYVHRKGATRCFPPGSEIPEEYQSVGQPVLVPGSMGTASYVLIGTDEARETFYSVCHGAGRVLSRQSALRRFRGESVKSSLGSKGILVRSASWKVLAEEAPDVYKDIDEVVKVCEIAGISKTVAKLRPLGVVKG
ncbi:MAG: RtcB family protein [Candidatus Micrarchaeota archaeon]|nr:RtcB family protein [Candidatus Micrarchaeota archaeon]